MNLFDPERKKLPNGQLLMNYGNNPFAAPTFYIRADASGKLKVMCFLPTVGHICRDFSFLCDIQDLSHFFQKWEDDPEHSLEFFFKYEGPRTHPTMTQRPTVVVKPMISLADLGLLPGGKK